LNNISAAETVSPTRPRIEFTTGIRTDGATVSLASNHHGSCTYIPEIGSRIRPATS
jgi:hypothetical protein